MENSKDGLSKEYEALTALQGMTLTWVGFDEEADGFYLLFTSQDGGQRSIFIQSASIANVAEPEPTLKMYLEKRAAHAKQVLILDEVFYKNPYKIDIKEHRMAFERGLFDGLNGADLRTYADPSLGEAYGKGRELGDKQRPTGNPSSGGPEKQTEPASGA